MEREEVSLAAIMFTDIVGYTSLSESDQNLALKLLEEHRKIVRPLISKHKGKEVKTIGDAFLAEFGSAVEATICGIEIQESLNEFNAPRSPKEKILLRIGIHLGDVVHSNQDVYGDAVNLASRIEGLCEPGGISLSRQVYDSVRSKMRDVKFESLGFRQMKNVKSDLEVYRVVVPWGEGLPSLYGTTASKEARPSNRIAVLPFVNIGPDPSDEYFADGLTEELISRLSQARDLRVIARTSAMSYKNERQKKAKDIGRELAVGTVVEGSVRKSGSKVRITVQVVDASSEEPMWSSTYDRSLEDIFEIQSDIASKVAESITSNLAPSTQKRGISKEHEQNAIVYTYYLHGRHLLQSESESSIKRSAEFFTRAIDADPGFARAYVGRAQSYLSLLEFMNMPFVEGARKAEADVKAALKIDPDLAEAHAVLSAARYALDEFASAEEEARRAIELSPSLADGYHALGHIKWIKGQLAESVSLYETAYKLDPLKEESIVVLGEVYLELGRVEDALKLWSSVEHIFPMASYAGMFFYYVQKKHYAKAEEFLEKFRSVGGKDSAFTLSLEGTLAAANGEREKALNLIDRIERSSGQQTLAVTTVGLIYYALGDMDKFFEYMDRAMEMHELPLGYLVNSPVYAEARKDPRLKKLLEKLNLKVELASV